jgi:hypothetical protein
MEKENVVPISLTWIAEIFHTVTIKDRDLQVLRRIPSFLVW